MATRKGRPAGARAVLRVEQGDLFARGEAALAPALEREAVAPPAATPAASPAEAPLLSVPRPARPEAPASPGPSPSPSAPRALRPQPEGFQRLDVEPTRARPLEPTVYTVSELTELVKGTLEASFRRVLVRGEVSGFRGPNATGHLYFSLKDSGATLDVKIWASSARSVRFRLEEGLEVLAEGYLDVYARAGRYSLIVQRIEPAGAGALALAFAQLKERLSAEGLMGEGRRRPPRPLPRLPARIGIVTSRTGAVLQDFLRIVLRRHPRASILLAHARVQGPGAAEEVVRALARLARTDVEVVVVARGGGSAEDLWTFNEEAVARAIAAHPVPVVSAVGHETDVTISDFVADVRAPTPSAAAELVVPVLAELEGEMAQARLRLGRAVHTALAERRHGLAELRRQLESPRHVVADLRQELVSLEDRLEASARRAVRAHGEGVRRLRERLDRFRPEALLAQRRQAVQALRGRLLQAMHARLVRERERLVRGRRGLERRAPAASLAEGHKRLAALRGQLQAASLARLGRERQRLSGAAGKLDALSPLKVMARGYAVAYRADSGALLARAEEAHVGLSLVLRWAPPGSRSLAECGEVDATVTAVRPPKAPR
ncbi:MAG: exodeoxyribonuclease VII large subunit [Myxococcaceae bacterium]